MWPDLLLQTSGCFSYLIQLYKLYICYNKVTLTKVLNVFFFGSNYTHKNLSCVSACNWKTTLATPTFSSTQNFHLWKADKAFMQQESWKNPFPQQFWNKIPFCWHLWIWIVYICTRFSGYVISSYVKFRFKKKVLFLLLMNSLCFLVDWPCLCFIRKANFQFGAAIAMSMLFCNGSENEFARRFQE